MDPKTQRVARLNQLLELASVYRGWSRKQLGAALGRTAPKLVPPNGYPKLDALKKLSDALDWPVADVVEYVLAADALVPAAPPLQSVARSNPDRDFRARTAETPRRTSEAGRDAHADFASLHADALASLKAGEFAAAVTHSRAAVGLAQNPEQRARAFSRMSVGFDGQGLHMDALEAVRSGLAENPIEPGTRLMLRSNLANAYYTLWYVYEGLATAKGLVDHFDASAPFTPGERFTRAHALYVLGNSHRVLIVREPDAAAEHIRAADLFLSLASDAYMALDAEFPGDPRFAPVANTCAGARLEVAAAAGTRSPESAVAALAEKLDTILDPGNEPVGDWLESWGWWAVFACNIAMHHLHAAQQQRVMAVYTDKADQIAQRLNNWALRERVFTLEYARRQELGRWMGAEVSDWVLDREDVGVLVGAMGRFPSFRRTGYKILECATLVG